MVPGPRPHSLNLVGFSLSWSELPSSATTKRYIYIYI